MKEGLKELYMALKDSPSAVIMTILLGGACLVYNDIKGYLAAEREQAKLERVELREELKEERNEQRKVNQEFIATLQNISARLSSIESELKSQKQL